MAEDGLPGGAAGLSAATFADALAHELGHATQVGGVETPNSDAFAAEASGLHAEGVAVQQEYLVAQQLGITMYSGIKVQNAISSAVSNDTIGSQKFSQDAINAGAQAYSKLTPSTVFNEGGAVDYEKYYILSNSVVQAGGIQII